MFRPELTSPRPLAPPLGAQGARPVTAGHRRAHPQQHGACLYSLALEEHESRGKPRYSAPFPPSPSRVAMVASVSGCLAPSTSRCSASVDSHSARAAPYSSFAARTLASVCEVRRQSGCFRPRTRCWVASTSRHRSSAWSRWPCLSSTDARTLLLRGHQIVAPANTTAPERHRRTRTTAR